MASEMLKRKEENQRKRDGKRKLEASERVMKIAVDEHCGGGGGLNSLIKSDDFCAISDELPTRTKRQRVRPRGNTKIADGSVLLNSATLKVELAKFDLERQSFEFDKCRNNGLMGERKVERKAQSQDNELKSRVDIKRLKAMLNFLFLSEKNAR